jgi:hypothetical protein
LIANSDADARIARDVPDPLRLMEPFREDVKAVSVHDKPDFDLARQARVAADRRQIQIRELAVLLGCPQRNLLRPIRMLLIIRRRIAYGCVLRAGISAARCEPAPT